MPARLTREQMAAPKVTISSNGENVKIPSYQYAAGTQSSSIYSVDIQPPPPTDAFANGRTVLMDLNPLETSQILDLELELKVSVTTAAVELVPSPYLIKEIVLEEKLGDQIARIFPETIVTWIMFAIDKQKRKRYQQACMYKEVEYESEGTKKFWSDKNNNEIAVGETRYITIPIPLAFFHTNVIDGRQILNGMRFRIEFSNDVVVSGSSSNISLDNIAFKIKSVAEDGFDLSARKEQQQTWTNKFVYLDTERAIYNDKTLSNNKEVSYDLSTFTGKSPYLLVIIKNATQQASDKSRYDYYEVSPEGTFDLKTSSGASILGNGTAVTEEYLYRYTGEEFKGSAIKGAYIIPLCEPGSIMKTLAGVMAGGYHEFVGQKETLAINFPSTGTAEVHNIAKTNTNTAGFFQVCNTGNKVAGTIGNKSIAHNATVATIKGEIEALPAVQDRNYTVTVGAQFSSGTSPVTVTFDANRDGPVSREIGVVSVLPTSLNASGTDENITGVTVGTRGKKGWNGAGSYSTEIYMFKFKELTIDQMGRIYSRDI